LPDRSETKSAEAHVIDVKAHINQKEEDETIAEVDGRRIVWPLYQKDPRIRSFREDTNYSELTHIGSEYHIGSRHFRYINTIFRLVELPVVGEWRWHGSKTQERALPQSSCASER
jgi:hypothetical protein